ncbi:MAG: hypothetical protein OXT09_35140, partial [Myxococcales bacterium]|nr:hypothetical protein [Myxococcales bacterium]
MNPRLLLTLVVLGLVGHMLLYVGVIVDDAYISFRYARNLSEGLGLVYNPGERVEGYTNFLWVVVAAAGFVAGLAPPLLIPPVGALSALALLLFVHRSARALAPDAGAEAPPWAALILAASAGIAFYSVTGLETVFYTLLTTIALVSAARQRAVGFATATALAFMTRPEVGLLGVMGLGWLLLGPGRERATARRDAIRAAAIMALLLAPYLAFKLWYFGELLPNTIHAKRPSLAFGLRYVVEGHAPAVGLVAITLWQLLRGQTLTPFTFVGSYWLAATVAVALTGGDWMWAERMLV